MRKTVFLLMLFGLIVGLIGARKVPVAYDQIDGLETYRFCRKLSAEEFRGRLSGDIGFTKAARWVEDNFKSWGLQPFAGKYLHPYPSAYSLLESAELKVFQQNRKDGMLDTKNELSAEAFTDFLPMLFSDRGEVRSKMVFVGWGISAPEIGYDDYQGVDVQGKVVLCFRGVPDSSDQRFQYHDEHRTRFATAFKHGARGLIYIYPEVQANPNGDRIEGMLAAEISESFADKIFSSKGISAAEIKKDLQFYKRPLSFELEAEVEMKVEAKYFPQGEAYNVSAFVEGSDRQLKKEIILIGAHLDHCGLHLGKIFPGANDNASGSAVVLSVAQVFAKMKKRPKRSVLFVLFGGEEKGLEGSTRFARMLREKGISVKLMINLDMEGAGDRAMAFYSEASSKLKTLIEQADLRKIVSLTRTIRGVGVRGSDYAPFFQEKIPCISVFSNGPHLNYHQTGDSIFRINPEILGEIARFSFMLCYLAAN